MQQWQIVSNQGIDALECVDSESRPLAADEVRMKVHASSINYRDLSTIRDPESRALPYPRVPNSDGAGEVVETGASVTGFSAGDRVASCFFQDWQDGPCSTLAMNSALGGALDGVLAEEVILKARGIVALPNHLSDEEGSTLPCAGLTAWNALKEVAEIRPGQTVLLLGTGGVSIFALQFAVRLGARVIISSSSEEKLERARAMGASETINYSRQPEWQEQVLKLTGGQGADAVVEVGGAGTLSRSVEACRVAGRIALIGVLTGGEINPTAIMRKSIRLQGVYVGSRRMFGEMNQAIEHFQIKPVVDECFDFDDARSAYHAMAGAGHFGKLVIRT